MPRLGAAIGVLVACAGTSLIPLVHARSLMVVDLRKEVRQSYEGKLLLLKQPSCFDVLHFDGDGLLTRRPAGEPWTTCGLLRAEKVELRDGQITIDGARVIVALNQGSKTGKLDPVTTDRQVHVAIEMPRPPRDSGDLTAILSRVFSKDLARRMAEAWHADVDLSKGMNDASIGPVDGRIGTLEGDRAVYSWQSGIVTKPRALYKPGPSYPPNALLKKVAGTIQVRVVINENGFPEILEAVQHLREGLDARALWAVSQWRFERPLKDGKGAATMVLVDVKFHLPGKKKK
jgi:TonB family protein